MNGGREWRSVLRRIARERAAYKACETDGTQCHKKVRAWRSTMKSLGDATGMKLLATINRKVNQLIDYRDDIDAYGRDDHWASPIEALTGQGDCEDYAILKYASLLELGVSDKNMRIVIAKDKRRGIGHAVLSVRMNGKTYILDSLRKSPVVDTKVKRYQPFYSVNQQGQWINVAKRKRNTKLAKRKTIKVSFDRPTVAALQKPTKAGQSRKQTARVHRRYQQPAERTSVDQTDFNQQAQAPINAP